MKFSPKSAGGSGVGRSALAAWRCGGRFLLFAVLMVGGASPAADQAAATIRPAVLLPADGESGGGASFAPTFSGDSRHLAFLSLANNLVTNDNRLPWVDVFLCSVDAQRTQLISVNRSGTGGGNGNSWEATVSADGRFVAFISEATDLTGVDLMARSAQVYVRDTLTGITRLASLAADGAPGNGPSGAPRLSGDGRFVVFESEASNLAELDQNGVKDVFVRDLVAERTLLVSEAFGSRATGDGVSDSPRITAEGRSVLFRSEAANLTVLPIGGMAKSEVFLRDLITATTRLISRPAITDTAETNSTRSSALGPEITADGRYVAYKVVSRLNYAIGVVSTDLTVSNRFWVHRWGLGNAVFSSSPLAISATDGSLVCEVSYRFSLLAQQDSLVLKFWPTERTECAVPPAGNPVSLLLGLAHNAIDPLYEFRCFEIQPLADIVGGRIRTNGVQPRSSTDGRRVLLGHTLWPRMTDSLFSAQERIPPPGDDGMEVRDGAVLYDLGSGERKAFPLFASPLSLTLSPNGEWLAFDSPVPDRSVRDLNSASDVYVFRIGSQAAALISRRVPALPSHRRWPTAQPSIRSMDTTGSRLVTLGQWPSLPGFPVNAPYRDLFLHDSAPLRNLPITSYRLPEPGVESANQPILSSNVVIHAELGADGRFLTASIQSRATLPIFPETSDAALWSYDLENASRTQIVLQPLEALRSESTFDVDGTGKKVVFATSLRDVVPEDLDGLSDIYLFSADQPEQRIRLTQPVPGSSASRRGPSYQPFISPSGRWVIYTSLAGDLTSIPQSSGTKRLWLHDLVTQQRSLLLDPMPIGDTNLVESAWSADSSRFLLRLSDLRCFAVDPTSRTLIPLGSDLRELQISRDGRFVAAMQPSESMAAGSSQIIRLELSTGTRSVASVAQDGVTPGNGHSRFPQISPDGTRVYFASEATDLVSGDTNPRTDVYVRDFELSQTKLLSQSFQTGGAANGASTRPQLSPDGRTLFFQSAASDLIANDFDDREDLFLIRLSPEDADGDGLPDDWERRYFGMLTVADGQSDSDGDGVLDVNELGLALNPTDPLSRVSLEALSFDPQVGFRFRWQASPWGGHAVQYAETLSVPVWRKLDLAFPLFHASGVGVDTNALFNPARYYRILAER